MTLQANRFDSRRESRKSQESISRSRHETFAAKFAVMHNAAFRAATWSGADPYWQGRDAAAVETCQLRFVRFRLAFAAVGRRGWCVALPGWWLWFEFLANAFAPLAHMQQTPNIAMIQRTSKITNPR